LPSDLKIAAQQEVDAFLRYCRFGKGALDADQRKALQRLSSKAALQEGTDSEGGYLVPSDAVRLPTIIKSGVIGGVLRPICAGFTTSRDSGDFPTSTDDVDWAAVAEEAAPGEDNPTLGQVTFTTRKIARINKVSTELLEDSAADVPALLGLLFARGLGRYEDKQGIEGDGSTEPEGLRTTAGGDSVADYNASTAPDFDDVTKHYFDLPAQWRGNLTWFMTSSFLKWLVGITGAGVPRIVEFMGDPVRPVILGRPVVVFDGTGWDDAAAIAVDEEFGAVGDFSQYYFIDHVGGMTIRRLDELYAGNDQVGFFARKRYDGRVAVSDAFRIMKAAAS
jgi:HK97 family phage major capsid protein